MQILHPEINKEHIAPVKQYDLIWGNTKFLSNLDEQICNIYASFTAHNEKYKIKREHVITILLFWSKCKQSIAVIINHVQHAYEVQILYPERD